MTDLSTLEAELSAQIAAAGDVAAGSAKRSVSLVLVVSAMYGS